MCCLFGIYKYNNKKEVGMNSLCASLSEYACNRGTDATGISYNHDGYTAVYKRPKAGYLMSYKGLENVKCVMGHTRHATQGDCRNNYNNHPFKGFTKSGDFTLAHNGVLWNDMKLRKRYKLPSTAIQTDSYIAVQMLEYYDGVNEDSVRKMVEAVDGSFCFSILEDNDTLWLIKGDNPLSIIHFPEHNIYVYASTDKILYKSLVDSFLFDDLKEGNFEEVNMYAGDILKVDTDGTLSWYKFDYEYYSNSNWWDFGTQHDYITLDSTPKANKDTTMEKITDDVEIDDFERCYIEELKEQACYYGYTPEDVDDFLAEGFTADDIAEAFYGEY
jgi:glucosamine 6-phosphate synthetase-like amidotransferase/phosphosugar isomerase protein